MRKKEYTCKIVFGDQYGEELELEKHLSSLTGC